MNSNEQQIILAIYALFQNLPLLIKQEIKEMIEADIKQETEKKTFSWEGFRKGDASGKDSYTRADIYGDDYRG